MLGIVRYIATVTATATVEPPDISQATITRKARAQHMQDHVRQPWFSRQQRCGEKTGEAVECNRIGHWCGADEVVLDEAGAGRSGQMADNGEMNGRIAGKATRHLRFTPCVHRNKA